MYAYSQRMCVSVHEQIDLALRGNSYFKKAAYLIYDTSTGRINGIQQTYPGG